MRLILQQGIVWYIKNSVRVVKSYFCQTARPVVYRSEISRFQEKSMHSGSIHSPAIYENMLSWVMCPLSRPLKAQSNSSLQGDRPEWGSHQEDYTVQYSQIWIQPTRNFILGSTPPVSCLPCVDHYYLFRQISPKKRIKTSVWIHHIVLATVRNK